MTAGEDAGGDKRGKQAAALLIVTTEDYPALDLRVDDHAEPLRELWRLYDKSLERFQPFVSCLPSRDNAAGVLDRNRIEAEIVRFAGQPAGTRRTPGAPSGLKSFSPPPPPPRGSPRFKAGPPRPLPPPERPPSLRSRQRRKRCASVSRRTPTFSIRRSRAPSWAASCSPRFATSCSTSTRN